jgi:hypothetical protein
MSQMPTLGRHGVFAATNVSAGQAAVVPVHFSATSQTPALGRQTVVFGASAFAGQVIELPSQFSAGSHAPTLARQTTRMVAGTSGGHTALEPVQVSMASQAPAAARHTVVFGSKVSAGHAVAVPSHVSAMSQKPALARQIVAALMGRQSPFVAPVRALEHASQLVVEPPSQEFSQQNPSMHAPLVHMPLRVHEVPFDSSGTHLFCVVSQKLFPVQSVSELHEPAHTLP